VLLRRISNHVNEQNWFAVGVDFIIVVFGVFIGIQVSNWNEAQKAKVDEQVTLLQLADEFEEIKSILERQITVREKWVQDLSVLIETLEGRESRDDDPAIKTALYSATAVGRRPPRSATYIQLTAGDGLNALSNDDLKADLVGYDARLQRDAFIHTALVGLITDELVSNPHVDLDVLGSRRAAARIDELADGKPQQEIVRSYNLDGLREFENRYETIFRFHVLLLTGEEDLLALVDRLLQNISASAHE
jgi:hypothetical protein